MSDPPDSRTATAKHRTGPVRRLDNGLLDVTRKSGKHVKTIKANSQARLLRLPPELRNRIWEYTLGGHVFNVSTRTVYKRRKKVNKARVWEVPKTTFALLRVCRQIYAETALLPYKHNAFRFSSGDAFDWVWSLRPVEQNVISQIYITTIAAEHMLVKNKVSQRHSLVLDALHFDRFPGLRSVLIRVYGPFPHKHKKRYIKRLLRKTKPDVRVSLLRIKVPRSS